MDRYKQKKGKKKERSITSLNSLALRNAQRSYKTQLSLRTLSIKKRFFCLIIHNKLLYNFILRILLLNVKYINYK